MDGVEYVRLADSIRSGNTCVWSEIYGEIDQVFEAVYFNTGKHGILSGRPFEARRRYRPHNMTRSDRA